MKTKGIIFFVLLILCSLFLFPGTCFSQHNNFQTFSIEKGLPHSNVYCLMQDSKGYLWAGTEGGLSRFDGFTFKVFGKKDGVAGNMIRALMEDSKGNIWIGTDEGISMYNGIRFKNITGNNGLEGKVTLTFMEDNDRCIWAGTSDGGLNKINIVSPDSFSIQNYSESDGLSNNTVFDLLQDKEKRIWVATFGGISIFTPQKDSFEITVLRGGSDIPSDMLLSIEEDSKGNLWFGTGDAGVFKIKKSRDGTMGEVLRYNFFNGFPSNTVWKILSDTKKDELWFGTGESGLCRLRQDSSQTGFITYDVRNGLPNNQVLCLLLDNERNLWMGTNGGGLCKLQGDQFSHFSVKDGLSHNIVRTVVQDNSNNYWFGTDGGGLTKMNFMGNIPVCQVFSSKQGLSSDFISALALGRAQNNDYLWIGTTNHGIMKYDGKKFFSLTENDGLISNRVSCLYIDRKGIVWCGTSSGISRFDGVKFLNVSTEGMMMSDEGVKTIIEDKKGNMWFGTAGGLARYSGESVLRTFDEVEGLNHKDVNAIAEAPNGNIWIGTKGGGLYVFDVTMNDTNAISLAADERIIFSNAIISLAFLDEKTLVAGTFKGFNKITIDGKRIVSAKNYNNTDGFFGMECNDNAIYKDKSGSIWLGTARGVTRYAPALEKNNPNPPQTHITAVKLFFKNVDWKTKTDSTIPWFELPASLVVPYSENHFTFEFTGITFTNPDKVLYSYKLEGLEDDWSPLQKDNKVTYSGLAPGEYTFGVVAVNENRKLAQPSTFKFTINPPWWRTWWFYSACAIALIALVISYIKIREKKLKEEKAILERKVVERTAEVVKQKEEIEVKNKNLEQANSEISHQKEIIEEKNKDITDSITYAQGIQQAILPPDDKFKKYLPDSFILFRPRDIVSGDFYWMEVADEAINSGARGNSSHRQLVLFAVCDCTGHGVPGGFVSMVGNNGLTRTVNEQGIIHPAKILDKAAVMVEQTFSVGKRKDGMDVVLCGLCRQDENNFELEFAAANNPLYFVRKKQSGLLAENGLELKPDVETETHWLFQVNADKQPVGAYEYRKPFTNHLFSLLPGDTIYLSSDGFRDQFGGQKGKKFMAKNFKQVLLSIQDKTMEEQKEILDKTIVDWMSGYGQNDDICVIGVRI